MSISSKDSVIGTREVPYFHNRQQSKLLVKNFTSNNMLKSERGMTIDYDIFLLYFISTRHIKSLVFESFILWTNFYLLLTHSTTLEAKLARPFPKGEGELNYPKKKN